MSADDAEREAKLTELASKALGHEGGVIGNFVIVAEVVEEAGTRLIFSVSDGTPPWTAVGMVQAALGLVEMTSYGYMGDFEPLEEEGDGGEPA